MATWKTAITLGFVGAVFVAGCTVKEGDDDGDGGEAGEPSAGKGGSSSGSSGKGGAGTGGSSGKGGSSGSAGTAGSSGVGGDSGAGGTPSEGGAGGDDGPAPGTDPQCDPDEGNLPSIPYDNCEPVDGAEDDACQLCIQANCCEESKECYGYSPDNVCGWGGEDGEGEIVCYQECLVDYIAENDDICDVDGEDECIAKCTTAGCGLIGNRTQALTTCLWEDCATECFGVTSCD
jgi:hypothetical protein